MVTIQMAWADAADRSLGLPSYETQGAAGADLRANFPTGPQGAFELAPSARARVPTGLHMQIPDGFEVQVRPRSGLAIKHGLTMINAPGTIDSDYRGEVAVLVVNLGEEAVTITHGMRIAQMVVAPVVQAEFHQVETLAPTARGEGGFGSTGTGA